MKVQDVMHAGVRSAKPEEPIAAIAAIMREEDIGAVPVANGEGLVGMLTDRDIALRVFADGRNPLHLTAADIMTDEVAYCLPGEDVDDAIRIMEQHGIRRLPVVDEEENIVGMLSIGDVVAKAPASLTAELMKTLTAHHA
ncbi:CBS domain-containing protein [Pacificimonas sp. ICDLI1SI03]